MERALIEKAQAGDHEAFLKLLALYDRQIMSVVYRFTCDHYDRQDLYQEVFLCCFKAMKQYRFKAAFSTWLYRIALNRCLGYIKKKVPIGEVVDSEAPGVDWDKRAKVRAIGRAFRRLHGPQRLSFFLYYIEEWEIPRIAEVLACKEGTVKSHLNRARLKIKNDREVLQWQTSPS